MNNLSQEIFHTIFDYLDIDELINSKRVSKKWNWLVNGYNRYKTLVLNDGQESSNCWFFTFKSLDSRYVVHCEKPDFFKYETFNENFINLRKLKSNLKFDFDLEKLNLMIRLEHLEIENNLNLTNPTSFLYLSNLRIFKINSLDGKPNGKLIIDSTRLEVFSAHEMKNIEIVNPETVKHIYLNVDHNENFEKFINLNSLSIRNVVKIDKRILFKLSPSIKSLHFYHPDSLITEALFNDIAFILLHKIILSEELDVKMYFQGIPLKSGQSKSFSNYNFMQNKDLDIFYKNFECLEPNLYWHEKVNYDDLVEVFGSIIPSKFFRKFINIQHLVARNRIEDENIFLYFVCNCSSLKKLDLFRPDLSQFFYDKLPALCRLLQEFVLLEHPTLNLDFEFILKFKQLKTFIISHSLSIDFVEIILTRLGLIEHIRFADSDNKKIYIRKLKSDSFNLSYGVYEYEEIKYSRLIDLLEAKKGLRF